MPSAFPPDSVGLVVPQVAHFSEPLALACGRSLPAYDLIYGKPTATNATASNAVLICHALSGHHHAAGFPQRRRAQARLVGQLHRPRQTHRPTSSSWSA
jgi:homoserine acetyltransferase